MVSQYANELFFVESIFSFDIINAIKLGVKTMGLTPVISLLQPPPEVRATCTSMQTNPFHSIFTRFMYPLHKHTYG
jgi:hypothetical protein